MIEFTPVTEFPTGTFKQNSTKQVKQHWVAEWEGYKAIGIDRNQAFDRLIALMQTRKFG